MKTKEFSYVHGNVRILTRLQKEIARFCILTRCVVIGDSLHLEGLDEEIERAELFLKGFTLGERI